MADGAPKISFTTVGPLLGGLAALITAGVAIYKEWKSDAPKPEAPLVSLASFDALPAQIEPGEAAVLRWRSEHAETCSLGPGIGAVGVNGSRSVRPGTDTTYTLRCLGAAGEAERSVSVSVVRLPERAAEAPAVEPRPPAAGTRAAATRAARNTTPGSAGDADTAALLEAARQLRETIEEQQDSLDEFDTSGQAAPGAPGIAGHCCDVNGIQRCPLVAPVAIGSPCFCPFQGTGISCP